MKNKICPICNKIIFGYFKYYLKENDEVLLTKSEHASNVLPWFYLAKTKGVKIEYITLHVGLGTFRPVNVEDVTNQV